MGNALQLQGTTIDQLRTIWDAAEVQYRSFTTSNKWVACTSAYYNGRGNGVVCDNCGGNHILPKCTQPRDEARIARDREARLTCLANDGDCGLRGVRNEGRANGRGRNRGGNGARLTGHRGYSRKGKFGPPAIGETVCMINGKANAACKFCN